MDRLWAPWRLEYVRHEKGSACFLCRVLEETADRANLLICRGKTCSIVLNRYPYNNGHLMVFPHRHIEDLGGMTADERLESMDLVARAIDALRETIHPDGFNVGVNLGKVAGAGLEEHVHMHVVPRWNGDTNFTTVCADLRVVPQSLEALWDELRPCMQ